MELIVTKLQQVVNILAIDAFRYTVIKTLAYLDLKYKSIRLLGINVFTYIISSYIQYWNALAIDISW